MKLYKLARLILRLVLPLFVDLKVIGKWNIPDSGCILAANHPSMLDALLITTVFPGELFVLGKAELFSRPLFGCFLRKLNAIPVSRRGFCSESFKLVENLLRDGNIILIFPEGKVSRDAKLQHFSLGFAKISLSSQMPVVPLSIYGSELVLPLGCSIPRRGRVRLAFGEPIVPEETQDKNSRVLMQLMSKELQDRIEYQLKELAC